MGNFLAGKVVAVTGAGRGIGRAVALAAAAEGARVVVNDYGVSVDGASPAGEVAEAVVKEIEAAGGDAVAVADDVSAMAGGQRVVDAALSSYGRLDGAVCVAGILRERMLFNMSEEEWDPVVATHLKGTFTVFRAASAVMRQQRSGTLIGFTSGNHQGSVSQANYSAAKGGIISLVRSAALSLHKYGVTANAVAPVARTHMSARPSSSAFPRPRPRRPSSSPRCTSTRPSWAAATAPPARSGTSPCTPSCTARAGSSPTSWSPRPTPSRTSRRRGRTGRRAGSRAGC
ncbi:SDR family NAD(P)-dependent oxidoreductase [Streptomyces sp. NPDC005202]|uniref:SDR family NAD(P)-dependent oxidoreductase n=1 Tax=Streptomyces sp. NPDC005202 TaxID=3157021 RepID=UPI0033B39B95